MNHFRLVFLALLACVVAEGQDGPSHVVVTYRADPVNRATFSKSLPVLNSRLTHWRDDGSIAGFQILNAALIDDEAWDTMIIAKAGSQGIELFKWLNHPEAAIQTTTVPADLAVRGR